MEKVALNVFNLIKKIYAKCKKECNFAADIEEGIEKLFAKYESLEQYEYLEDIRENDLLDIAIERAIESTKIDGALVQDIIAPYSLSELKKNVIINFIFDLCTIVLECQQNYLSNEGKILVKTIQASSDKNLETIKELFKQNQISKINANDLEVFYQDLKKRGDYTQLLSASKIFLDANLNCTSSLYFQVVAFYYSYKTEFFKACKSCLESADQNLINRTIDFLVENCEIDLLKTYSYKSTTETTKNYIKLLLEDKIIGNLVIFPNSLIKQKKQSKKELIEINEVAYRMIVNYFAMDENQSLGVITLINENPSIFEEFYYKLIKTKKELHGMFVNHQHCNLKSSEIFINLNNEYFNFYDKIITMDLKYQEEYFATLLFVNSLNKINYENYYALCPESIKEKIEIKFANYLKDINFAIDSINEEELINFGLTNNKIILISLYWKNKYNRTTLKCHIEKEHKDIIEKNLQLFDIYFNLIESTDEAMKTLLDYENKFEEKEIFHCYKACMYEKTLNSAGIKFEIEWISKALFNGKLTHFPAVKIAIEFLARQKKYNVILKLTNYNLSSFMLESIANVLAFSNILEYLKKADDIYQKLLNDGFANDELYYHKAVTSFEIGNRATSKSLLQQAFGYNGPYKKYAALYLLQMRCESSQFDEDEVFQYAKNSFDESLLHIVACIYTAKNDSKAEEYFLKTLLINPNNIACMNGLYVLLLTSTENFTVAKKQITIGTAVKLVEVKSKKTLFFCLHEEGIMENIGTSSFADCLHFSIKDKMILPLLLCSKHDTFDYEGATYKVEEIVSEKMHYFSYLSNKLLEQKQVTPIYGPLDKALQTLTDYTKKQKENTKKVIDIFNSSEIKMPNSYLGKNLGTSYFETLRYLMFENNKKIKNNQNRYNLNGKKVCLNYDVLIVLIYLKIDLKLVLDSGVVLYLPQLVKAEAIKDIEELLKNETNKNLGSLTYHEKAKQAVTISYSKKDRLENIQFLSDFKDFINSINTFETSYDINDEDTKFNKKLMEVCDKGEIDCIASAKNSSDSMVLTDDEFLINLSEKYKIPSIGITCLLSNLNLSVTQLLGYTLQLAEFNYNCYFDINIMSAAAHFFETEQTKETLNKEWKSFISFAEHDFKKADINEYHYGLIMEWWRNNKENRFPLGEAFKQNFNQLAVALFSKRNPDYIKSFMQNLSFRVEIDGENLSIIAEQKQKE